MECQNCHEREAVIHLTQIVNDDVTKLHLCEVCAEAKGIQTEASMAKFPLSEFLAQMGTGGVAMTVPDEGGACPGCGATLQDFREIGRLGCPACYETFGAPLRDLLRRLHGSSHHVGERYRAPGLQPETPMEEGEIMAELREQLREAIHAEQFERAAELRDRIRNREE